MEFKMNVGNGIIRSYRRLGYRAWYALAEFIDNATQNYDDNRIELAKYGPLEINIDYDKDHLRIYDTAMGMNFDELSRALQIGTPPPNTKGRSEYGLGLKTAACWFGDHWTITTKRLGDTTEYQVTVDVEAVATGQTSLPTRVTPGRDADKHYTIVDITRLHRKYHHQTKRRIEMYIKSMYRMDIRNADLWIRINGGEPLVENEPPTFLKDAHGNSYRKDFASSIGEKRITGWMGILNPGERKSAGIAIIRRGRAIKAQPEAWRPGDIYGIERNDLLNQRLIGEIHLDEFNISHTKDEILWEDDNEHEVEKFLENEFKEYIHVAKTPLKDLQDKVIGGPSAGEAQLALSELRQQMETAGFADLINLQEVPTDDIIQSATAPLIDTARREEPAQIIKIGQPPKQIVCKIHLNTKASPNDPYFATSYATNDILVSINTRHPHYTRIKGGSIGALMYFMECAYDALAEWKAMRAQEVKHNTVKILKDGFLRHELNLDSADEVLDEPGGNSSTS